MEPRLAPALATLRDQIDAAFPTRSKASDGWKASDEHLDRTGAGAAASQHNPNSRNVVCAIDVTEDLAVGLNCNQLMDELDDSNDPRIFYLIHDRQIDNSDDSRTPYTGDNPHNKHLHISTHYNEARLYEDSRPWVVPMLTPQEDDMPTPEEFADAVLDRKLDAVEYAHGKTIGPARTHTYIRHAAAHATKSSAGTAAILALLKSWSGEQLDVRGLARELVPLLAPALLAKGLTRDDVEDVFRDVLGGLDED